MYGQGPVAIRTAAGTWAVPYEGTFWCVWWSITILFLLDRFFINVWPRQSFGDDFGNDRLANLFHHPDEGGGLKGAKEGLWTVQAYDAVARISGRVCITATNGLFITMCHNSMGWAAERVRHVKMSEWAEANIRIHRILGWILGLCLMPHLWMVFFPVMFESGWSEVKIPTGEGVCCPGSRRGVSFFDMKDRTVNLDGDDVWRLAGMTTIFAVLIPLSLWSRFRNLSWTAATWMHAVAGLVYTADLVRRKSHPHCWVLNLPVLLWYFADKLYGSFRAAATADMVNRFDVDEDHYIAFFKVRCEPPREARIGDVWKLAFRCGGEVFHPFTTMSAAGGDIEIPDEESADASWEGHVFQVKPGETEEGKRQSLVRNMKRGDTMKGSMRRRSSHRLATVKESRWRSNYNFAVIMRKCGEGTFTDDLGRCACSGDGNGPGTVLAAGPFISGYSILDAAPHIPPLLLVASGAGAAYIMDFISRVRALDIPLVNTVSVYYTVRSLALMQFVTNHLMHPPVHNVEVHAALTKNDGVEYETVPNKQDMQVGRFDIGELITMAHEDAQVYFCGAPALQKRVGDHCAAAGIEFHSGHAFGE